jgi:hypothetical protein
MTCLKTYKVYKMCDNSTFKKRPYRFNSTIQPAKTYKVYAIHDNMTFKKRPYRFKKPNDFFTPDY